MKKTALIIVAAIIISTIVFSCAKNDNFTNEVQKEAFCADCNEKADIMLSSPQKIEIQKESFWTDHLRNNEFQNFNTQYFGSLNLDNSFVYNVIDGSEKVLSITTDAIRRNSTSHLIVYSDGEDNFVSFVHEMVESDLTFTLNEYDIQGNLLLSGIVDKSTGQFISITSSREEGWTWTECMKAAWEACMADYQCSILCALVGPECVLATATACLISVNNSN
jgi:hypothetical protein